MGGGWFEGYSCKEIRVKAGVDEPAANVCRSGEVWESCRCSRRQGNHLLCAHTSCPSLTLVRTTSAA